MGLKPGYGSPETTFPMPRARSARRASRLVEWMRGRGLTIADMFNPFTGTADVPLLITVVILLCVGLLMIYSASLPGHAVPRGYPLDHWARRQLTWVGVGLAAMLLMWRIRYTFWQKWAIELLALATVLLMAVLFIGEELYGARRTLFSGSIQPSEFTKLVVVIYMSVWMASKGENLRRIGLGLVPFGVLVGIISGLIFAEPDRSTGVLIILTAGIMFCIATLDVKQLTIMIVAGAATVATIIASAGYARQRVGDFLAFLSDPLKHEGAQMEGFIESLKAGKLFGVGLTNGTAKYGVSLPHTDGIFAVIGEEFGLLGCLVIIGLYLFLVYRGTRIALRAPNLLGLLMASGVTIWLALQAFINIAVAAAVLPTTGIPLPFLSYGGSAVVSALAGVGVLLSVSCSPRVNEDEEESATRARAALRWGNRWSRLSGPDGR